MKIVLTNIVANAIIILQNHLQKSFNTIISDEKGNKGN